MAKIEVDSDLKEILPNFIKNRQNDIGTLKDLVNSKDFKGLEKLGHKVAGSSGGYGFSELGEIAKSIENQAKVENIDELSKLVDQFESFVTTVEIVYV